MIRHLFSLLVVSVLPFLSSSCSTLPDDSGPGRPYTPRVSMPEYASLNANERRFLPQVEDALTQAGLRPTNGGDAEYRLAISLDDGPVNADSTLTLFRSSSEIARSYARVGGPSIIFSRSRIVQESFEKCLRDFESKIPHSYNGGGNYGENRGNGRSDGGGNGYNDGRSYNRNSSDGDYAPRREDSDYNNNNNSGQADWQRGGY